MDIGLGDEHEGHEARRTLHSVDSVDLADTIFGMMGRVAKLGTLAVVTAILGIVLRIGVWSYVRETREFFPERRALRVSASSAGLTGLEPVAFSDREGVVLRGWYVHSRNRAGVILLHGAGGDRTELLPEARHLESHGFGVLLFDWPGHGESDGQIHWSEGEAHALVAAVDFLSRRVDLDAQRLGALGFSMGGAVLALVAPSEARLRAVVLAGTPSDHVKQIEWAKRRWGPLSQIPALWAVRRGGLPLYGVQPRDRVGAIAPRPVLVVGGTDDQDVPAFLANDLFAAAREPKELLLVEGTGHGGYERAPGSTYLDRLTDFFERALLERR
jgi:pimeloyl-ACP methyl ester carboxylesterase